MKKFILFTAVLLISIGILFPKGITVTSPKAGAVWNIGERCKIIWTKNGDARSNVKINIFKDSISVANFVKQLKCPNNGSMIWMIPKNFSPGKYQIRVKIGNTRIFGDSGLFNIKSPSYGVIGGAKKISTKPTLRIIPKITVTSPKTNDTLYSGKSYPIFWMKKGNMSSNVKINIFSNSISVANFVKQLKCPNNGSMTWMIPGNFSPGKYILRVITADKKVFGDSGLFNIKSSSFGTIREMSPGTLTIMPEITVTSPVSGDIFHDPNSIKIDWVKKGSQSNFVKIQLFNSTGTTRILDIVSQTVNSGSYLWNSPKSAHPGIYKVKISTVDKKVVGNSGSFRIERMLTRKDKNNGHITIPSPGTTNHTKHYIKVISPKMGDTVYSGENMDLRWIYEGYTANNTVDIYLIPKKGYNKKYLIIKGYPLSTKIYNFKLDRSIPEGEYFPKVEIRSKPGLKVMNKPKDPSLHSGPFKIEKKYIETLNQSRIGNNSIVAEQPQLKISNTYFNTGKKLMLGLFKPTKKNLKPGENVELNYIFQGADFATISDYNTGRILKYITINGKDKVSGKFRFPFKHPAKYLLTISSDNGKISKKDTCSVYVNRELKFNQGINKFDIIANWRFSEEHIDLIIDVFGANSIQVYQHNMKTGKKLRIFHSEPDSYKRFKFESKPYKKLPSKDFSKTYYFSYRVTFWDGQIVKKTVTF